MPSARLIAGVMSGTSADGIDVALCRLSPSSDPHWGELIHHHAVPYAPELKRHIHEARTLGAATFAEIAALTRALTLAHADAVRECLAAAGVTVEEVRHGPSAGQNRTRGAQRREVGHTGSGGGSGAREGGNGGRAGGGDREDGAGAEGGGVADHGQTLFHAPPLTTQLLDPALLAYELGLDVFSDFRRADCAAGGQGAPLVPYADLRLFHHPDRTRVLLNLGGIANLTLVPADADPAKVRAFDTGPANCLSDHLCRTLDPQGPGFDRGGHLAAKGTPHESVLAAFLHDPYFRQPPPKSTDGPAMIAAFDRAGGTRLPLHDALATAAEAVARSVADAVLRLSPEPQEVIISGGGVHHLPLVRSLTRHLHDLPLLTTDQLGVPSAAKEAIAFALLGNALLDRTPANIPTCTGAKRPVISGSITPAP